MWDDPVWIRWQIEHQKTGDPSAYNIWMIKKFSITIKVDVIPTMQALNCTMITAAEATRRLKAVYAAYPTLKEAS